jgi:uncharacterized protein
MVWTALILGFAGSLHCMGMCSPLMMSVTNMSSKVVMARLLYNTGRIFSYGILGSIIASVGFVFPLMKYQNLLSIVLGIGLLGISLTGISALKIPFLTNALGKFSVFLKNLFSKFLTKRNSASTFVLGSLNGMLPCGLSFLALTYCLALARPIDGFNFMALFGVGTLPVMFGFTSVVSWLGGVLHINIRKLTTAMLALSGVLLIARVFVFHGGDDHALHSTLVDIVMCR